MSILGSSKGKIQSYHSLIGTHVATRWMTYWIAAARSHDSFLSPLPKVAAVSSLVHLQSLQVSSLSHALLLVSQNDAHSFLD